MDEPRRAVPPGAGLLGAPDLGARLERWVAEARSDHEAAARARTRWMRVQAEESATFSGVLTDLAERATPVVVHGRAGRRHRGAIALVAQDFCALHTDTGVDVFAAYRGISSIRPDPQHDGPSGDRIVDADLTLVEMLRIVAADRPRVLIVTTVDRDGITGELRSVGQDVVAVRPDGSSRAPTYVSMAVIAEVVLV